MTMLIDTVVQVWFGVRYAAISHTHQQKPARDKRRVAVFGERGSGYCDHSWYDASCEEGQTGKDQRLDW